MCLNILHVVKQRKKITDKITRKGLTVHKIVAERFIDKSCRPPFTVMRSNILRDIDKTPYKNGINEANTNFKISQSARYFYKAGFHFFKSKADAKRTKDYLNNCHHTTQFNDSKYTFKLITCIVKKSWITATGVQKGIINNHYDWNKKDVVIVAKKAIFNL